eukprot:187213-Pyramimonas_sp.AAC.1
MEAEYNFTSRRPAGLALPRHIPRRFMAQGKGMALMKQSKVPVNMHMRWAPLAPGRTTTPPP